MAEEYRIACTDSPEDADFTVIGLGIRSYNEQQAGVDGHRRLCLFLPLPMTRLWAGSQDLRTSTGSPLTCSG